jgi:hypothetical protein
MWFMGFDVVCFCARRAEYCTILLQDYDVSKLRTDAKEVGNM